jgi:hypothetical protein
MIFPLTFERGFFQPPISLTFSQEIKISFEIVLSLLNAIGAFFYSLTGKMIDDQKIDPKDIPFSTPIHGMYALKSIRTILENIHEENILKFIHKANTSIRYSVFVPCPNSRFIEISAEQLDCNGNIIHEKKIAYNNNKLSIHIFQAQNEPRFQGIITKNDLEVLIKFADKDPKEFLINKFFDIEREYEDELSAGKHKGNRKFSGADLIKASFVKDAKKSRKVKDAKSFLSTFKWAEQKACELILNTNDLKGHILENSKKIESCLLKPEVVEEQIADQEQETDLEFEIAMQRARAEVSSFMMF